MYLEQNIFYGVDFEEKKIILFFHIFSHSPALIQTRLHLHVLGVSDRKHTKYKHHTMHSVLIST